MRTPVGCFPIRFEPIPPDEFAADLPPRPRPRVVAPAFFPVLWCTVSLAVPFGARLRCSAARFQLGSRHADVGRPRPDRSPAPRDLERQLRSATGSVADPSTPIAKTGATNMSPRSLSSRSAISWHRMLHGCSRRRRDSARFAARSTPQQRSSEGSSGSAGRPGCTGPSPPASPRDAATPARDQLQPVLQSGGRRTERAAIPGRRLPQLPVSSDRLA